MTGLAVLVTTCGSNAKARELAAAALAEKLAACVQVHPIRSHYVWKGELREDEEFLLTMKLRGEDYAALAALLRRLHDYETPEILRFNVADGDPAYLDWVLAATSKENHANSS